MTYRTLLLCCAAAAPAGALQLKAPLLLKWNGASEANFNSLPAKDFAMELAPHLETTALAGLARASKEWHAALQPRVEEAGDSLEQQIAKNKAELDRLRSESMDFRRQVRDYIKDE